MFKHRRLLLVLSVIVIGLFLLTRCTSNNEKTVIVKTYQEYAGVTACKNCHGAIYKNFVATAHYRTSAIAIKENIKGSFDHKNVFDYNPLQKVVLEQRDSGFYQSEFYNGIKKTSQRFDIIIGSATLGQTYLYWQENNLYQLPVSYYTAADSWANSPGYPATQIFFKRAINARCLECHATFAKNIFTLSSRQEAFDKKQIIYGVTCENCHGPAAQHVAYYTQHPDEKTAKFIINPAKFSAARQLDNCALCHSGQQKNIQPPFSFVIGDTLSNYYEAQPPTDSARMNDVHGNKYNLLTASKCFKKSINITCSACHNAHNNERDNLIVFSQRCMNCHTEANNNFCKMAPQIGAVIKTNCIDCHMPSKPSTVLSVQLEHTDNKTPAMIRTHLIKIYPEETNKVLAYLKKVKG